MRDEQPAPCPEHETNQLNCSVCSAVRKAFYEAVASEDHPGDCLCSQCEADARENDDDGDDDENPADGESFDGGFGPGSYFNHAMRNDD